MIGKILGHLIFIICCSLCIVITSCAPKTVSLSDQVKQFKWQQLESQRAKNVKEIEARMPAAEPELLRLYGQKQTDPVMNGIAEVLAERGTKKTDVYINEGLLSVVTVDSTRALVILRMMDPAKITESQWESVRRLSESLDRGLRLNSIAVLAKSHQAVNYRIVIDALTDDSPKMLLGILYMIAPSKNRALIPAVAKLLRNPNEEIRIQTVITLNMLAEGRKLSILSNHKDKSERVMFYIRASQDRS